MINFRPQQVVFQPTTYRAFQQGVNKIANAIRPTLGPRPRVVAIDRIADKRMPELLDDGGTIARRIIQLPGRNEDVGAMFIREMLWRLHDQVGDGTATAAVLFQKVYNEGVRYLAAGGSAQQLHDHLHRGMTLIIDQISAMSTHLEGKENLAGIAESVCYDPPLAKLMGEIFDIIGEYGRIEIRGGRTRELKREYVEGMYWERGLISREMIDDQQRLRTDLENAAILISDLDIDDPSQLLPPMAMALEAKLPALFMIVGSLSDKALSLLLANQQPDKFKVIVVKTPGWGKEEQAAALADLAVLTGGRPFIKVAGDTFSRMKPADLGQARRVWADRNNFGIIGGKGSARALREHIAKLRTAYARTDQPAPRDKLRARIGKLLGGSATLWIGGVTEHDIEARKEVANRTASAMRAAITEGVVPGGGVALLACRSALQQKLDQSSDADERAAYHILLQAIEEPVRTIAANAGHDPSRVMAQITLAGPGHGFDVISEQVVDVTEASIYDATMVQKMAVFHALSSAALALTIDVMIHRNGQGQPTPVVTPARKKRL